MSDISNQVDKIKGKRSLFEFFTEMIGWIQIVASPFLIGSIIGAIVYFPNPDTTKLIIAIIIAATGLFIGIIWATRVWRKKGTIHFMSRLMSTPELDNKDEDQE